MTYLLLTKAYRWQDHNELFNLSNKLQPLEESYTITTMNDVNNKPHYQVMTYQLQKKASWCVDHIELLKPNNNVQPLESYSLNTIH